MRVSRRHWRHAESLFSAHARRRLDQRSRAHRSARHACRRRSRRGSWSVRRPRGQGAAEARAEGGRLVFYTPSHRPARLATGGQLAWRSKRGLGREPPEAGAEAREREAGGRGSRRGCGARARAARAARAARGQSGAPAAHRPRAVDAPRAPQPLCRPKKTKRHAYAAARCEAPPGGQMESGPRGRGAGRRRHALHRLVEPRRRAFTRSPSQPGRRRARSSSCAWGLNCGEFWGGLRRAAEATARC